MNMAPAVAVGIGIGILLGFMLGSRSFAPSEKELKAIQEIAKWAIIRLCRELCRELCRVADSATGNGIGATVTPGTDKSIAPKTKTRDKDIGQRRETKA